MSAPIMMRARRGSKYLVSTFVAGLAVLGIAALVISFFSFHSVLSMIVGAGGDDQLRRGADSLARNFDSIVSKLRFGSAVFFLAAGLIFAARLRLQTWIEEAVFPLARFLGDVAGAIVRTLRTDGALHAGLLLAFTLVGAAIRIRLLSRPMGTDEAETFLSYASRPLYLGLSWYPAPNNHLFHTFFVHFSCLLFGSQEWAIRLPALCAGVLLIPLSYWAARVLYDKYAALIAAGLVTAASTLLQYSADGRGYTMVCVFFLLMVITGEHLRKHDSQPAWLLWALFAILGAYTIPTMVYAVGAAAVSLLIASRGIGPGPSRRRFLVRLAVASIGASVAAALLYTPVLIVSGWRALFSNGWVHAKGFSYLFANAPPSVSRLWGAWTAEVTPPLIWLLAAGFAVALIFHRRIGGQGAVVVLAAAMTIVPLVIAQRVVPPERVWLFLLPLCAAVSGAGLWFLLGRFGNADAASRGRFAAVLASVCVLAMCIPDLRGTRELGRLPGTENTAVWIKGRVMPGDLVVVKGAGWSALTYYFRRHAVPLVNRPAPCDPMSVVYTAPGVPLRPAAGGARRVLTVGNWSDSSESVLSGACLAWQPTAAAQLVYSFGRIRIYEGEASSNVAIKSKSAAPNRTTVERFHSLGYAR